MSGVLPFLSVDDFTSFIMVLARIAGLFAAIPLFGGNRVPQTVKAAAILAMTLVLFPIIRGSIPQVATNPLTIGILVVREALVGITLSILSQLIFAAVEFCGQLIGMQMGLSIASLFDPDQGQTQVIATFQGLLAMLFFMTLGVHHLFIRAIVESYEVLPVGAWHMSGELLHFVISATSGLFVLAIKLAAPVMVSLLAAGMVLGIMARSFPQMNVFMISFPLNIGLGLLILGASLMAFGQTLNEAFGGLAGQIRILFKLMA
ncbi:MAG TPA: flagellar biosynthetic protein FliR [Geobacteraceae bacterium]|nr:flagellar biosynthetic protein FliR [Geobacteraceae bacterium]